MTRRAPIRQVAGAAMAVALLLGCSGGDEPSSDEVVTTSAPTSPSADTAPPTTLSADAVAATDGPATSTPAPDAATDTTTDTATDTTTAGPVIATVPEADSVLAIIDGRDDLTVFARLAETIGSPTVFQQDRGVTILAPTDAAWAALFDEAQIEAILADRDAAALWLSEHLSIGSRTVADLRTEGVFRNAMTRSLTIEDRPDGTFVGDARFEAIDLQADNGYIHVIDAVLIPPG